MTEQDMYDKSYEILSKPDIEGFHSNLPLDPGGPTLVGFSSKYYPKEYAELNALCSQGSDKVHARAKELYKELFWDKYDCGSMEYPGNIAFFVQLVNAPAKAIEFRHDTTNWRDFLMMFIDWQNNDHRPGREWDNEGLVNRALRVWKYILNDLKIRGELQGGE